MARLTDSEWRVLCALWDCGGGTLGALVDALYPETKWSRNTVLTYLTRMEAKGLVAIDRENYPSTYRPAVDRESCRAAERRSFLSRVYQGSAGDLVAAFLKEEPLSSQERDALKALLDEMEV